MTMLHAKPATHCQRKRRRSPENDECRSIDLSGDDWFRQDVGFNKVSYE